MRPVPGRGRFRRMASRIVSTGSFLPERVVTNESLSQFPQNAIPLIEQKTGVRERRHAGDGQCTSDLAAEAAANCLAAADTQPSEIDAILLATSSPDRIQPATATRVQMKLQATHAFAFDINSVCTGGVFGLHLANALIQSGAARKVLVVAAEVYSRYLNPKDFSTYPYFGDGAGAVLLSAAGDGPEIVHGLLRTDGTGSEIIQVPAGGTMLPYARMTNPGDAFFKMAGKEVYQFAITRGPEVIRELLAITGIPKGEIAAFVLHQANLNIIETIASTLDVPLERFPVNLQKYGNTAAASVFIALHELLAGGTVGKGKYIVMAAFGGGLSWGAILIKT
jgi:3-oxoacyl-[acyl-carrier-protein] synthase-3